MQRSKIMASIAVRTAAVRPRLRRRLSTGPAGLVTSLRRVGGCLAVMAVLSQVERPVEPQRSRSEQAQRSAGLGACGCAREGRNQSASPLGSGFGGFGCAESALSAKPNGGVSVGFAWFRSAHGIHIQSCVKAMASAARNWLSVLLSIARKASGFSSWSCHAMILQ